MPEQSATQKLADICFQYFEDRFVRPKTPKQDKYLGEIKDLLDQGADATAQGLLVASCASRCLRVVQWMVKAGADVNQTEQSMYARTPLMMTADAPKITRFLLKKGANVHARTKFGNTVLHEHLDVVKGHIADPESIRLLLEAGAEIEARNSKGQSPLLVAADRAPWAVIEVLLEYGADISAQDNKGQTALDINTWERRENILSQAWLDRFGKMDMHATDADGRTLLMKSPGALPVVEAYLKKGADPHALDNLGMSVLMHHSRSVSNHGAILIYLVDHCRVDIDLTDKKGMTALLYAVLQGYYQHSLYLLEKGANWHVTDHMGNSILHHLLSCNSWTILFPKLITAGVAIDHQNHKGRTPLMEAVLKEDMMFVQWLIEAGANVDEYRDQDGLTAKDHIENLIAKKQINWTPDFTAQVRQYIYSFKSK